jgi:hypothetical protein
MRIGYVSGKMKIQMTNEELPSEFADGIRISVLPSIIQIRADADGARGHAIPVGREYHISAFEGKDRLPEKGWALTSVKFEKRDDGIIIQRADIPKKAPIKRGPGRKKPVEAQELLAPTIGSSLLGFDRQKLTGAVNLINELMEDNPDIRLSTNEDGQLEATLKLA